MPVEPFRILILGDFSGRSNRAVRERLSNRRPILVDRDNYEDVLAGMNAELDVVGASFRFRELDDFHPDALYRDIDEVVEAVRQVPDPSSGSLLDQILDAGDGGAPAEMIGPTGDLAGFIAKSVRPHLEPKLHPAQQAAQAKARMTTAEKMRAILHHPDFQALEAAWRAIWMLVRGLDLDGDLKLYLYDVTLEEIAADPSGLQGLITASKQSWALIMGNFAFGQTRTDAKMLSLFGLLAQKAKAPFLAEATPPSDEAGEEWRALRREPEASSIGLALPRFLLRLPYGKATSPVEKFPFEEMPESVHQHYLWGNPAFCCVLLLGQSFLKEGWELRPGTIRRIDDLPLHVYQEDGESCAKPCAEVLMTERTADSLMEQGIMPLASLKEQDAVLLVRFQSIADPPGALAGRWQ